MAAHTALARRSGEGLVVRIFHYCGVFVQRAGGFPESYLYVEHSHSHGYEERKGSPLHFDFPLIRMLWRALQIATGRLGLHCAAQT